MTRVAVGWPTTFCDSTAVRSSLRSAPCFLERFCDPLGFSTAPSALIISAAFRFTRGRRRCSRVGFFHRVISSTAYNNLPVLIEPGKKISRPCDRPIRPFSTMAYERDVSFRTDLKRGEQGFQNIGFNGAET